MLHPGAKTFCANIGALIITACIHMGPIVLTFYVILADTFLSTKLGTSVEVYDF